MPNFFWFRRDLRLHDNAALYHALKDASASHSTSGNVQCIFIFDTNILDRLEDKNDRRVDFIYRRLEKINGELKKSGASLLVKHGTPADVWKQIVKEFSVESVFCNHDYEPYARKRDEEIKILLAGKKIPFNTFKDQVIFEKNEIAKDDGSPYAVYTAYMKKWRSAFTPQMMKPFPTEKYFSGFAKARFPFPKLEDIGFMKTDIADVDYKFSRKIITAYDETRNIPSLHGTSRLSTHLRFGTVSIREAMRFAFQLNPKFVNELIWREFYMMILWHFPQVTETAYKPSMRTLTWHHDEAQFDRWCNGLTGYPIVDAGMRELNQTGFMHNRVRMIAAMFLTKYLLIDWQWGEAYFAKKLSDFELSSNNGNWQWVAGTGVDAAPYFRIFNMEEQTKKFDPGLKYIERWVPEFRTSEYPKPMVEYKFARERCLEFFKRNGS
jgi:deoxyribodipyrimidine photo-lyase